MSQPSLTLFFVVEPPDYLYMACHLAASIRTHLPPEVVLIGYCPAHRWAEMNPAAVEVLRRLRCEIRPIETEGRFDPPYPHGNKILAALDPKDTDYAAFLDSDMLFLQPCTVAELVRPHAVGVVPSTSMRWSDQSIWPVLYGLFGMAVPDERITMTRDKRMQVAPYFNAGLLVFDERHRGPDGRRFAEVWMDTAQVIDGAPGIDNRRPATDQQSLIIATRRASMSLEFLDHSLLKAIEAENPADAYFSGSACILKYQSRALLRAAGLMSIADGVLKSQVGTSRVRAIFRVPISPGLLFSSIDVGVGESGVENGDFAEDPDANDDFEHCLLTADTEQADSAGGTAPTFAPAVSKTSSSPIINMAAVTMVRGDHVFLRRWVDHHGTTIGRQNLYVLRHGPDPEIDRIAAGTNIVNLPLCSSMSRFDRRRWSLLSDFANGLTHYHDWVLVNDVDEIVVPDPSTGVTLPTYLANLPDVTASVLSPFAVEIVHTPASEPEAIKPDRPILSVRRNFRLNSNYAKPCLIRKPVGLTVGGHGSNAADARLDPQLWLFHLRYMDDTLSTERLRRRQAFIEEKAGSAEAARNSSSTWARGTSELERLRVMSPIAERSNFPDEVQHMVRRREHAGGNWFWGRVRSSALYRLPQSFGTPF